MHTALVVRIVAAAISQHKGFECCDRVIVKKRIIQFVVTILAAHKNGKGFLRQFARGFAGHFDAGVFAEPAGAAAHAGLIKAKDKGFINTGKPILVLNTGNGLKDIRAAMRSVGDAPIIEPSLDALRKLIK